MMHKLLIAAMWAGLISLDITACGPFMVSQPLVCGPLFGWLVGQTAVGVIVGGIVQLLWMDLSPVGVGIPYDATAATLLAVTMASIPEHCSLSQLVLALIIAVPFGFFFRWMDQYARRLNVLVVRRLDAVSDESLPITLWLGILTGLVWTWVRYAVSYVVAMGVIYKIWTRLAYVPRLTRVDQGLTMAIILLPVAGMGVTLELFLSEEPEGRWVSKRRRRRQTDETP